MFSCLQRGSTISADKSLPKNDDYSCPECHDELIHCAGTKNQPYFRHVNHTACVYTNVRPAPAEIELNDNMTQLQETLRIATLNQKRAKLQLELAKVEQSLGSIEKVA